MKNLLIVMILVFAAALGSCQTIELGYPTNGAVIKRGKNFVAEVILPISMASCVQVGIALAVANCPNGVCPQPESQLGEVLYAGPWNPVTPKPGGFYQNFTVQVSTYMAKGQGIFTLTHFCLLGAGPFPFLEFRNASIKLV